jgi:hypothetical protein
MEIFNIAIIATATQRPGYIIWIQRLKWEILYWYQKLIWILNNFIGISSLKQISIISDMIDITKWCFTQ